MQESMQSTYNYLVPADGTTHEVSYSGTLVSGQPYTVDWHSFVQNNFPFRPQGAKIQNPSSDNVTIENLQTGETSTCPPNSSRWVTFTSTSHMQQQISGSGQVSIIFVDYPVMETAPVSLTDGTPTPPTSGDNVTIVQGGETLEAANPLPVQLSQGDAANSDTNPIFAQVTNLPATQPVSGTVTSKPTTNALTDASGSIGTASTSQELVASATTRSYFFLQNNSSDALWFNFTTDAVIGEPSIELAAGANFVMDGTFVSNEKINIIGATAGQTFTCKVG